MALHPNGVNHLAISTNDMKAQLTFFADVLGCPTKALYWMHGVEGCYHGFAELSPGGPPTRTTQTFDAMLAIVRLCAGLDSETPG